MARKIFITYKYSDSSVLSLNNGNETRVRDYVDKLQSLIDEEDHINKGEEDGTTVSNFKDDTIESILRDKIYDSSITVVLVSKRMKDPYFPESDQWMPWEISYSLKEHSREGRTSLTNAMLAVTIPDKQGSYEYYIRDDSCSYCHCRTLETHFLFGILKDNMFNIKKPEFNDCHNHPDGNQPYKGYSSYIYSVKWVDFISDIDKHFEIATKINENIENYTIVKQIR